MSGAEFWRSCPRAIRLLSETHNEMTGRAKKKETKGPRLSYIPR